MFKVSVEPQESSPGKFCPLYSCVRNGALSLASGGPIIVQWNLDLTKSQRTGEIVSRVRCIENLGLTNLRTWNNQYREIANTCRILFCFCFVLFCFFVFVFVFLVWSGFGVLYLVFKARRTNFSGSNWQTTKQSTGLKILASYNFYHRRALKDKEFYTTYERCRG